MRERTGRTWNEGLLPSQTRHRENGRGPRDPFTEIWASDVVPLLKADETGRLDAKTIIEVLGENGYMQPQRRHVRRQLQLQYGRLSDW